jgi:proteasome lid subunit RPN8/RPN11
VPQCPFAIEYDAVVLDDIRLAVVDAFFSLPRGGAEIGGVLFGRFEGGAVHVRAHARLDCEHAFGPSFTLSAGDHGRFAALVAAAAGGLEPVGWYHSHTRSEIFLSEADVAIHERYFPLPWQVALVLRPFTFKPARAGFFFREPDGGMRAEASYEEFEIQPLAVRPAPAHTAEPERPAPVPVPAPEPAPLPEPAPAPAPEPEPPPPATPVEIRLSYLEETGRKRRFPWLLAWLAAGLALGVAAFETRTEWLRYLPTSSPQAPPPPVSAGLAVADTDGQLQIRWDRTSKSVTEAREGLLEISEATGKSAVQLDPARIRAGSFTYGRQTERVDVKLSLRQPNGSQVQEFATFMGKLPAAQAAPAEDPRLRAERDALSEEVSRLKKDLNVQTVRSKRLEDALENLRKVNQRDQLRRLENQSRTP